MKCRICEQEMHERGGEDADHHLHVSPMWKDMCAGCWYFTVEMELFLVRGANRAVMGNWTEGWLREILENPKKHLD